MSSLTFFSDTGKAKHSVNVSSWHCYYYNYFLPGVVLRLNPCGYSVLKIIAVS